MLDTFAEMVKYGAEPTERTLIMLTKGFVHTGQLKMASEVRGEGEGGGVFIILILLILLILLLLIIHFFFFFFLQVMEFLRQDFGVEVTARLKLQTNEVTIMIKTKPNKTK